MGKSSPPGMERKSKNGSGTARRWNPGRIRAGNPGGRAETASPRGNPRDSGTGKAGVSNTGGEGIRTFYAVYMVALDANTDLLTGKKGMIIKTNFIFV